MSTDEVQKVPYKKLYPRLVHAKLEHSRTKIRCHPKDVCAGQPCSVHNRSDHRMRAFPQLWRKDRQIMERVCTHGVGHPDPDDHKIRLGLDPGDHGCDGCCHD